MNFIVRQNSFFFVFCKLLSNHPHTIHHDILHNTKDWNWQLRNVILISHVGKDLLTFLEHMIMMISHPVFDGVPVTQSLVFYVLLCAGFFLFFCFCHGVVGLFLTCEFYFSMVSFVSFLFIFNSKSLLEHGLPLFFKVVYSVRFMCLAHISPRKSDGYYILVNTLKYNSNVIYLSCL